MKLFNTVAKPNQPVKLNRPTYSSTISYSKNFSINDIETSKLRVGYFSTAATACGIAIYTEHLVNALLSKGCAVFIYSNRTPLEELLVTIDYDKIHVLNIQYEPAIMPSTPNLIAFIKELQSRRIKVIVTFHSESEATKQLGLVANGCIFHKPSKYLGFTNQIVKIPMGVPVYNPSNVLRSKYGFKEEDVILTTTGFMFTWKQHANILAGMVPYLKSNSNYKVQLLTAFNDVNPSECIIEKAATLKVIEDNSLQDQVTLITNFLSQEELSDRLYISNLGYLWSALTTTSSSAASKEFISARLPLVITESNHYHDMVVGVSRTPIDKGIFISRIFELVGSTSLNKLKEELEDSYKNLNNNAIIDKHIEVFKRC